MPNPRPLALIGIASAVAAIAFPYEGVRRLHRPVVQSIVVRPDTVWFCAAQPDSARVAFGFARASRAWRTDRAARACAEPRPRLSWLDTLPLRVAPGIAIQVIAARDSEGYRNGPAHLRLIDSARALNLDLKPSITPSRVAALSAPHGNVDDDTVSTNVGGAIANDTLIWIGLDGGFPEGSGSLGGIYRIDRRTGEWRWIVDSTLSWNGVTGLAQTQRWLWVGTEQPMEFGAFGRFGLLRMNPSTGLWRNYTTANSPLPDALIVDVAADDDIVAVATEKGLAVAELESGAREIRRWNVRHFVPAFAGDTLTYRLGLKAEAPSAALEERFVFVETFGIRGRERPLFRQLQRLPLAAVSSANDGFPSSGKSLANPDYAPILVAMFASRWESQRAAAGAMTRLGRRTPMTVRAAARSAFVGYDTLPPGVERGETRRQLANALRAAGDSTAIRWSRRVLDTGVTTVGEPGQARALRSTAVTILSDARDPDALPMLIAAAATTTESDALPLITALAKYDSPRAWRAAMAIAEQPRRSDESQFVVDRHLVHLATPAALRESFVSEKVRRFVRESITSETGEPRRWIDRRGDAVNMIRHHRLDGFAAALVARLSDRSFVGPAAYQTLVYLYGRADAPVVKDSVPADAISWWTNVFAKGELPLVPRSAGEQASRRWLSRRYSR